MFQSNRMENVDDEDLMLKMEDLENGMQDLKEFVVDHLKSFEKRLVEIEKWEVSASEISSVRQDIECFSASVPGQASPIDRKKDDDDDEFRFNDASTHEGHLRQNGELTWFCNETIIMISHKCIKCKTRTMMMMSSGLTTHQPMRVICVKMVN